MPNERSHGFGDQTRQHGPTISMLGMQTNTDNNHSGFNDVRDKIVEQAAKLLGNITHSNSHFASTKRSELPAYSGLNLSGAIAGDLLFERAPEVEQTRRIIVSLEANAACQSPTAQRYSRRLHTQLTGDAPGVHAGFERDPIFA